MKFVGVCEEYAEGGGLDGPQQLERQEEVTIFTVPVMYVDKYL